MCIYVYIYTYMCVSSLVYLRDKLDFWLFTFNLFFLNDLLPFCVACTCACWPPFNSATDDTNDLSFTLLLDKFNEHSICNLSSALFFFFYVFFSIFIILFVLQRKSCPSIFFSFLLVVLFFQIFSLKCSWILARKVTK